MNPSSHELGCFLKSRRGRLAPLQPELQERSRRVSGLRREEVARIAGVSPDYCARLEQGRDTRFSDSVLEAVARALQLSPVDRAHVLDLADAGTIPSGVRYGLPVSVEVATSLQVDLHEQVRLGLREPVRVRPRG